MTAEVWDIPIGILASVTACGDGDESDDKMEPAASQKVLPR